MPESDDELDPELLPVPAVSVETEAVEAGTPAMDTAEPLTAG